MHPINRVVQVLALCACTLTNRAVAQLSMKSSKDLPVEATTSVACGDAVQHIIFCTLPEPTTDSRGGTRIDIFMGTGPKRAPVAVTFATSNGTVVPDTTFTDTAGYAHAIWTKADRSKPGLLIAMAKFEDGTRLAEIHAAETPAKGTLLLKPLDGNAQQWYEKNNLRRALTVEIQDGSDSDGKIINSEGVCLAQRVAFSTRGGGTITPDTAFAELASFGGRDHCVAKAYLNLGDVVGKRLVRANLVAAAGYNVAHNTAEMHATSRSLPQLVSGVGFNPRTQYYGMSGGSKKTYHVERAGDDGRTITYDSVATTSAAPNKLAGDVDVVAFGGITMPIPLKFTSRVAITGGVNLADFKDDWYLGFSFMQAVGANMNGSNAFDIHVLANFGRRDELDDEIGCFRDSNDCHTTSRTAFRGVAVMFTIDAATVLSDLARKLLP